MTVQRIDAAQHSPSSAYMELVNVDHQWTDFDEVVAYLSHNIDKIIYEVHHELGKLLIDNGHTQLNCPPPPEPGDSHGSLLLRSLSERAANDDAHTGITVRREVRVHDCGPTSESDPSSGTHGKDESLHWIEIRENTVRAPTTLGALPVSTEQVAKVCVRLAQ